MGMENWNLNIFYTPNFPHSAFSTLQIFHTLRFLHSKFSTLRIFYTPQSTLLIFLWTQKQRLNISIVLLNKQSNTLMIDHIAGNTKTRYVNINQKWIFALLLRSLANIFG